MQQTSADWKRLWAAGARLEARATIAGTECTLVSAPVISRALTQGGMTVGNAVSATCQLSVRTGGAGIPRAAPVVVEMRLSDGADASEWLPAGTFYISRRQRDPITGVLALECYDALLRANAVWEPEAGSWPRAMSAVLTELATLLGVSQDGRNVLITGSAYVIDAPEAGTTIRDALCRIAAANGGSFILTPDNKLRLVPLASASEAAAATADAVDVMAVTGGIDLGASGAVTGVRYPSEGGYVVLGDETGIVVDADVGAAIAGDLYAALRGMAWQGYSLAGAVYDPAAELGDWLRAGANGEIASVLCSETATLGPIFQARAAAPEAEELADEYPYIGKATQALQALKLQLSDLEGSAIVHVDVEYAQNQDGTTAPTSGWSTDAPAWRDGYCIWQRTATVTARGTSYSDPVCVSGRDGGDGRGVAGVIEQYYLSTTDAFPASGSWSAAQPAWESGKYIWTRSQITWSDGTVTTTEAVLARALNGANQSAADASGAVATLDGSLDQQSIFNRLTNNGQAQGIYISNGQLYVSASYILSGILRLGGVNNGNGVLNILNSSGQVVGTWDNTGLSVNNGAFSVDTSGKLTAGNSELSGSLTCSGTYGATPGEVIIQGGSIRANKAGVEELWISGSTFMALEGKDLYFVSNYPKSPRASVTLGANGNITVNATKILLYPTTANDGGIYVAGFKGVDGDFTTADGKLVAVRRGLVVQIS